MHGRVREKHLSLNRKDGPAERRTLQQSARARMRDSRRSVRWVSQS